jgi:hypothetical protein
MPADAAILQAACEELRRRRLGQVQLEQQQQQQQVVQRQQGEPVGLQPCADEGGLGSSLGVSADAAQLQAAREDAVKQQKLAKLQLDQQQQQQQQQQRQAEVQAWRRKLRRLLTQPQQQQGQQHCDTT